MKEGYQLPPLDILDDPEYHDSSDAQSNIEEIIVILETTLADFNIGAKVVDIDRGPVVTRYELDLAPGTKVTRITSLANDIAMAVKASSVRIVAPIPGKSTVGVEVPNKVRQLVRLKELIATKEYKKSRFTIPALLGKDTSGKPIMSDLTRMPHLLIAGSTGAGKSVCINSILTSILMTKRPEDLQLILIDPKMVELSIYEGIPHLLCPVVTDMKRAPWILEWATKQMDERYDFLSAVGVRHITQYNALGEDEIATRLRPDADAIPNHLPYIVIVIDELADLMMSSAKEVESSITRLAQKSRAVGIHILVATQRPSVDVITGLIKANMPTRISFQVASKVDSRTILDRNGAETLLGMGDQLFLPPGTSDLLRLQGTFVSDQEIRRIVTFVKQSAGSGKYKLDLDNWGMKTADAADGPDDELYEDAIRVVLESRRGSVSLLQRKLEIGYTRASRLVDYMAKDGVVGSYKGSKAREVLMTLEEWEGRAKPEGYGQASLPDEPE
jgi:S-DNA-T family DNA segregation ATPase FtsK/SpoIIIE